MELKELKKLVAYCRSAGITTYKTNDVEFTLSLSDPREEKKLSKKIAKVEKTVEQKLAELSEEDLLLYSASSFKDTETEV
jgi:hypothetical protein